MKKNECYEPNCNVSDCNNPEHYNFICFDPDCDDVHCENHQHYDAQLLRDFQEKSDLSVYDHREKIDYSEDVDINLCACPDCADDDDHEHHHDHDDDDDCDCHDHEHNHGHDVLWLS
ncbi:hypothetical protein [uncultured Methanobrevibacter sp.]|uniref:hypothetical protein n=1 Tax=uncultured Methanobrevibacter sp. TaxID=253161 RepID=UPI0025E97B74|nr:hypothetical protein [uncultured Methanobrevibacter sp.]